MTQAEDYMNEVNERRARAFASGKRTRIGKPGNVRIDRDGDASFYYFPDKSCLRLDHSGELNIC
jgi:hypothetical protein